MTTLCAGAVYGASQAFVAPRAATGAASPGLRGSVESAAELSQQTAASGNGVQMQAGVTMTGIFALAAAGAARRNRRAGAVKQQCREQRVQLAARGGAVAKKKVLVMGGTRFIGCYLVAELRKQGHDVFILNRGKKNGGKPEALPGMSTAEYDEMMKGVTVLIADRGDPESVKKAVTGAGKFDVVFDNNARKLVDVEPLVEAIQATGGCEQFIFMSSAGVYGPTDVLPLNEETPGDPKSRHAAKLSCEELLAQKGFNWTSIRPVYIYGPLNYNPVERFFFDRVARGRPIAIPYDGMYITQLGHCEDLADFMCKCIGNPKVKGQCYNVSGEDFVTFDGMAKLCAEAAGKPEPKIVHYDAGLAKGMPEDFPKAFPFRGMHFFASIEKAKEDVPDWTPKYSLLDGLKSSYKEDYVGRGFDKKEVDYRTDDAILDKVGVKA